MSFPASEGQCKGEEIQKGDDPKKTISTRVSVSAICMLSGSPTAMNVGVGEPIHVALHDKKFKFLFPFTIFTGLAFHLLNGLTSDRPWYKVLGDDIASKKPQLGRREAQLKQEGWPAPLQTEIEEAMEINDAQFNMYFSIKAFSSMMPPFFIALIMSRVSLRTVLILLSLFCTVGQGLFAVGLSNKNHNMCLLGRFFIGLSDTQTIF